ncbi:hypothetical protein ACF09L_19280 [Streptomyces sp. NPDC014779]|uniref:hypothetical protein n=1 Tax=Streptomyces sp. NPDC014779 TaxID=3364911 RepID=UPI0037003C03
MATFPVPDPAGTAYIIQMWGASGGAAVSVGLPGDPNIDTPAVQAAIKAFAADLAAAIDRTVSYVARHETVRTELAP